jgi:hypothetical protein
MGSQLWTRAELRAQYVLVAEQFNRDYDPLRGVLNGGLDRMSTPPGWVDRTHLVDNATQRVTINSTAIEMPTAIAGSGGSAATFNTLNYGLYAGGWYEAYSAAITGRIGVMHVEFSCLLWQQLLYTGSSPKGTEFRILWNGVPQARVGPLMQAYANPYITADFPVGGDGTLSVEFRFTPGASGTDDADDAQMFFGGGQLLAIGRWR